MVKTVFTDKEWYYNFRVSKETFQNIVSEIEDEIVPKDTAMSKAISSREKKLVWHGQLFTLHISSKPGREFGNTYQFHPCSDIYPAGPSTGEILARQRCGICTPV